jgi:GT2 family glycosyltransferase
MDRSRVPPARVPGNNWRDLAVAAPDRFEPELPVSVVVTYYEAPEALELTLAALEGQTYPREMFEVVIVDDGSRTPLAEPAASPLEVRVVHQEDRGFGLARARNTGARAADSEILVFLDCDMMPEAGWLAEHARWHHAANDALTLGFRAHVEVDGIDAAAVRTRAGSLTELLADRAAERPAWIEYHMTRTRELTSNDDDLFRVVTGGNLGVSRSFFDSVGGYDETFTQWGAEDTEFGYRAYTMGGLLVPARDALCWHQGAGAAPSEAESISLRLQQAKISQLVAHHGFRKAASGRSFTVPQYVVTVQPGGADDQMATAEQVLANGIHDLTVWIADPHESEGMHEPGREMIRRLLGGDPRVRFGPSDGAAAATPAASFHITIPAGAAVKSTTVARLRRQLGSAARASISLPDHLRAEIVRTRAVNRAKRSGISIDEHGSKLQPPRGRFGRRRRRSPQQAEDSRKRRARRSESRRGRRQKHSWFLHKLGSFAVQVLHQVREVRSLGDARNLAVWLVSSVVRALAWRIRRSLRRLYWFARRQGRALKRSLRRLYWFARRQGRALKRIRRRPEGTVAASVPVRSDDTRQPARYRIGPEIAARGRRAEAVLAASSRVGPTIGESTEVVIVDTAETAEALGLDFGAAVVVLSESDPRTSAPAFDAESVNPVGWSSDHRDRAVALGPPELLVQAKRPRRTARIGARDAGRRAHHVLDIAAYHEDAPSRAGVLAALAATGAVVHLADHRAELHRCIGSELYGLMADERIVSADPHQREAFSVAMRRCALRDHSLRARVRQLLAGTGLCGPPLPTVSILLATRRPDRVAAALDAVAGQTYPRVELVLALHGEGFDRGEIEGRLQALDCPSSVVAAAAHLPLGTVLNLAAEECSGTLLTKFDDDDLYGSEHLWDLVLAHEYSRAPLVGKGAEFVYLEGSGAVLRRFRDGGERYITTQSIAGGALMITRHCFDAVLGWRPIPRSVDQALIADVVSGGHRAYRTHGFGYVLVRHGEGHTWQADDDYFLAQADDTRTGCDLAFAGITPPGSHHR